MRARKALRGEGRSHEFGVVVVVAEKASEIARKEGLSILSELHNLYFNEECMLRMVRQLIGFKALDRARVVFRPNLGKSKHCTMPPKL